MSSRFTRRDRAEAAALAERLTAEVDAGRLTASDRLVRLLRAVVTVSHRK